MTPRTSIFLSAALVSLLTACGPTRVAISPRDVVDVVVRPAAGPPAFCPGEAFKVEVVAHLQNGQYCSSTDRTRGCLKEQDAVIDPAQVHIEGSTGGIEGNPKKFLWNTSPDPLVTASTGVAFKAWIEQATPAGVDRSMVAQTRLTPVYACQMNRVFGGGSGGARGENGGPGPDLDIAVTTLATPFYPDAALIRVISGTQRTYYISPSAAEPIRITSAAESGGQGEQGQNGMDGAAGQDGSGACARGGNGEHGRHGQAGGNGGNGGRGGLVRITLDRGAAGRLRGRVLAASRGGDAGPAGNGGSGGRGGRGGNGGPSSPDCTSGGQGGDGGLDGNNGPSGQPGYPGPNGPLPELGTAPREALFGTEMTQIRQIEATKLQLAEAATSAR
jgi:hypothetical protein